MNQYSINGKTYTSEEIKKIGNNLASLWGGSCISFEVNEKEQEITFDCIENGEEFVSTLKYDELDEYK